MSGRLKIYLKANERIFINGGALRVDRKTGIELLNDVVFLMESHVMAEEQATTPMCQLYLAVQSIMLDPQSGANSRHAFDQLHRTLMTRIESSQMRATLVEVDELVQRRKSYEALKRIRAFLDGEPSIQKCQD